MEIQKRSIDEIRQIVSGHLQVRQIVEVHADTLNKEKQSIEMSFSSEAPVMRWWGVEILSHKPEAIRMDRAKNGLAFCHNHDSYDQRGRCDNFRCDGGKTRGEVRFSRSQLGQDMFNDYTDGIRKETSIGYAVHSFREMKPEEMSPELQQMCLENKCGAYMADDWEPLEVSNAPVPADAGVGAGRSLEEFYNQRNNQPAATVGAGGQPQQPQEKRSMPPEVTTQQPTPTLSAEEVERLEKERKTTIEDIGKRFADRIHGGKEAMDQLVKDALELDRSVEAFRGDIYVRIHDTQPIELPDSMLDLTEKEKRQYSLLRLVQHQIVAQDGHPELIKADFELECSKAIQDKNKQRAWRGAAIPWDIQNRNLAVRIDSRNDLQRLKVLAMQHGLYSAARVLDSTTQYGADELVGTQLRADLFVDLLRNRAVCGKVGVQILFGLQQNLLIPKQSGAATWEWTGESGTTSGSALTTASISMEPHEGRAYQEYYRMLLLQSTPSIELLVQNDLLMIARLGIDKAVFHGSNTSYQPKGIVNETGVGSHDLSAAPMGWGDIVDMETDIFTANADADTMFYVTNPVVRGKLKKTPKAGNWPQFLCDDKNIINGYPTVVSNQISAGYMFFGDFSWELLGYWGNLDLLVNPYSGDATGKYRINIYADVDCALRQAGAVSVASSIQTS